MLNLQWHSFLNNGTKGYFKFFEYQDLEINTKNKNKYFWYPCCLYFGHIAYVQPSTEHTLYAQKYPDSPSNLFMQLLQGVPIAKVLICTHITLIYTEKHCQ